MSRRVTVIGAGPGGLAAALLLARGGARVTVLERRSSVGGRTSTLEKDGYRFDLGPTFFLYPRVLEEIFAAVGHDLWREVPMARLDPQYRLVFGAGGQIDATPERERMEAEIRRLCAADAPGFRRFLAENRAKLAAFRPILESPFDSLASLLRSRFLPALRWLRPWHSLERDLRRYFSDPRVRLAFSFQAKYLGMSPFRCPSLFSILSYLEYEHGVYHPMGGCGAVTAAMARIARDMGVDIRLEEPVEEILFKGRRAVGARTAKATYPTDALVINADFARAMHRLVPKALRRRWSDKRIRRTKFSCSTFMMYLGLDGETPALPHHTIYIARDYEENLRDIEERHVLSEDPSFYVQNAGVTDSSLAPTGGSTLYVLVPVTQCTENIDWSRETPAFRERTLRQLKKIGLDGLAGRIRSETIVTPDDWDQRYEIHRGATFNMTHNLGQMLHRRPHNQFEDLESVFLVGGGTHPGSGLPVIFESARITSRRMLEGWGGRVPWCDPSDVPKREPLPSPSFANCSSLPEVEA